VHFILQDHSFRCQTDGELAAIGNENRCLAAEMRCQSNFATKVDLQNNHGLTIWKSFF
jgi:hypothetical protein